MKMMNNHGRCDFILPGHWTLRLQGTRLANMKLSRIALCKHRKKGHEWKGKWVRRPQSWCKVVMNAMSIGRSSWETFINNTMGGLANAMVIDLTLRECGPNLAKKKSNVLWLGARDSFGTPCMLMKYDTIQNSTFWAQWNY